MEGTGSPASHGVQFGRLLLQQLDVVPAGGNIVARIPEHPADFVVEQVDSDERTGSSGADEHVAGEDRRAGGRVADVVFAERDGAGTDLDDPLRRTADGVEGKRLECSFVPGDAVQRFSRVEWRPEEVDGQLFGLGVLLDRQRQC